MTDQVNAHSPQGAHLLIVDDVPEYTRSLEVVLRAHFRVSTANSVTRAQESYYAVQPAAALVDVRLDESLPNDRSGLDLVRWLKAESPELPVIVMSAVEDVSLPEQAKEAGADAFIKKPINLAELRRVLSSLISRRTKEEG